MHKQKMRCSNTAIYILSQLGKGERRFAFPVFLLKQMSRAVLYDNKRRRRFNDLTMLCR